MIIFTQEHGEHEKDYWFNKSDPVPSGYTMIYETEPQCYLEKFKTREIMSF